MRWNTWTWHWDMSRAAHLTWILDKSQSSCPGDAVCMFQGNSGTIILYSVYFFCKNHQQNTDRWPTKVWFTLPWKGPPMKRISPLELKVGMEYTWWQWCGHCLVKKRTRFRNRNSCEAERHEQKLKALHLELCTANLGCPNCRAKFIKNQGQDCTTTSISLFSSHKPNAWHLGWVHWRFPWIRRLLLCWCRIHENELRNGPWFLIQAIVLAPFFCFMQWSPYVWLSASALYYVIWWTLTLSSAQLGLWLFDTATGTKDSMFKSSGHVTGASGFTPQILALKASIQKNAQWKQPKWEKSGK